VNGDIRNIFIIYRVSHFTGPISYLLLTGLLERGVQELIIFIYKKYIDR